MESILLTKLSKSREEMQDVEASLWNCQHQGVSTGLGPVPVLVTQQG